MIRRECFIRRDPGLLLGIFSFMVVTVVVVAGTSNAVNLTDGMDGLASGCVAVCCVVFMLLFVVGDSERGLSLGTSEDRRERDFRCEIERVCNDLTTMIEVASTDECFRYQQCEEILATFSHPANPEAHYLTTGPEIWRDTNGRITHLVAGVGTSGTIMGAGRFLKEQRPDLRLIAVEPDGPFHGLEGLKHMATAIVPTIYDPSAIDETLFIVTEEAESRVQALAVQEGLFVGWSTGAALVAAKELLSRHVEEHAEAPVVVVIAPDGGTRYLSESRRLLG